MRRSPSFLERLSEGPVLCDGAMGTYLYARGVPFDRSFPEQNLLEPELVESVHREYVDAGAEILETNTYGANRFQLERYGLADEVRRINIHGCRIARQAAAGRCYVAGAVGPLGRSLEPLGGVSRDEALGVFAEQIEALAEGGADLLMIETISELEEMTAALEAARSVCDLPIVVHKTFTEDGSTLMGELPHEVVERAEVGGADVVGANCTVGPQRMLHIIERMASRASVPLSALPTAGLPRIVEGRVTYFAEPAYMGRYAKLLAEAGARIVGACCGSTPEHIAAMREGLEEADLAERRKAVAVEREESEAVEPVPLGERSGLAARLGHEFLVLVDLQLPRSPDLDPTLRSAASYRDSGVDAVVLSDSVRARLCVHPVVAAYRLRQELDLQSVLVYATRDRNVLGIQSDLLGAHVLEVRNILVSAAEPANVGDYPTATTLHDVDPTALVKILDSMNRGLDLAGNAIGEPTAFVPLSQANPAAHDLDREIERLGRHVAAGTEALVTFPQFDLESLEPFLDGVAELGVPVIVGLLPLRSGRHAAFLHNEVPGMSVPEKVRARLEGAADPAAEGEAVAREFLEALPERVAGVYIVPPYEKPERALRTLEALHVEAVRGKPATV